MDDSFTYHIKDFTHWYPDNKHIVWCYVERRFGRLKNADNDMVGWRNAEVIQITLWLR